MEIRTFSMEVRELAEADGVGSFTGHASAFGVHEPAYNTVFDAGAFKRTIKARNPFAITWMHSPLDPLGVADLEEDDKGLLVHGRVDLASPAGQRAYSGLRMGYIDAMSHGFDTVKDYIDGDGVRHIKEAKLWEVALVTRHFGANPDALVAAVRSAGEGLARMRQLQEEGSHAELKRVAAEIRDLLLDTVPQDKGEDGEGHEPQAIDIHQPLAALAAEVQALRAAVDPRYRTPGRQDAPQQGQGDPQLHSLLENLRAYKETLSRR